jgi:hypothetical protein
LALQGTLDTFSLPDVLRLLATTAKSGRLRIEGDRGQGSIWLHQGKVVDAAADRAMDGTPPDEVTFELLRFEHGSFAFDTDDRASDASSPHDVEDLLRKAHGLLSEWGELEAVVPSLAHQVTLSSDLSADEVTIDADHWRTVVAVASGRTVGEMATTLELTELAVSRAVRDLVELGVAEVGPPDPGAAPPRLEPVERPRRSAARVEVPAAPITEIPDIPDPQPIEGQRAGWLTADRTGEFPTIAVEPTGPTNGAGRGGAPDDLPHLAKPPAAPTMPTRLARGRNAAPEGKDTGPAPRAGSGESGRTPVVRPDKPRSRPTGAGDTGRTPRTVAGDTGRNPRVGAGDTGRSPVIRPETPRGPAAGPGEPPAPAGPDRDAGLRSGPADTGRSPLPGRPAGPAGPGGSGPAGRRDAGAPPRRASRPGGPAGRPGDPAAPLDNGRSGPPPPRPHETGQIRPVSGSSLPPDLHWAADDVTSTGPISSPFSGLTSLGPSGRGPSGVGPSGPLPPPHHDGEIAPHVAAMSPEARAAVQSTVGNAGGISHGRGGSQGEDIAQRSRLISFLSSVR